jgi:uncharacterized protein
MIHKPMPLLIPSHKRWTDQCRLASNAMDSSTGQNSPDGHSPQAALPRLDSASNDSHSKALSAFKASQLREAFQQFGDALRARRKGIDDLNVYPVPDGDTGTNMSLTVQSVLKELKSAARDDMASVAAAISKGAIMGARGNSGAILAQALRGLAESVKTKPSIGPSDIAEALDRARKSAYESVLKPVEGTILTVLSAAADAAHKSAGAGHSLADQLEHVRSASAEALARTPDLLPVLKQAGVVDAGGSGFLLFVDALRYVATGEPISGITDVLGITDSVDLTDVHSEISDLRYEVMFLIDAEDARVGDFRQKWSEVGDSIVVVGGDRLFNCHIHTDDIGASIEIALDYGRPREIRITDLQEQSASHAHDRDEQVLPVETAVVAVVDGDGLMALCRSMGVQGLVRGGQSMNPSVADLLAQVEAAPSHHVILLPNNKNVIAAARQVNDLTEKDVSVIPTRSVVEGLSALMNYDCEQPMDRNYDAMRSASANVVCGEITQSVRNSDSDAGPIEKGNWLGIGPDGISVITDSLSSALIGLVELLSDDHELLTLIEGSGAESSATESLRTWLSEHRPSLELETHQGGQSLYPYLLGLE